MTQSHHVLQITPSSIPVYVPPQQSTHHPTVALRFVPSHFSAHHHHNSATATRGYRDSNGSRNAMNIGKRFHNKDSNYSGADNENIMDFIVQYDLVSWDFHQSQFEKLQYVHNLFRGEALRYYYAEIEPLGSNYANIIAKMKSQFNLISKEQCVKAELSGSSLQGEVEKSEGNRRKALRYLQLFKHWSLFVLETGETNRTKLTSSVTRYWQKTGLDSICIALKMVLTFDSYRSNLLAPYRYTKKYWPEVGTAAKPVLQACLYRSLQYSSQRRSILRE